MSKLVLSNRIPRDYNPATFQEIIRLLEEQSNLHAEGRLRARHGAMTAAPTIGNWEKGDFVWNSNPSVSSNRVIYGWLCTVSGTPGTWVEVGVSTAVLAATQAEQESATSTGVYATPGRQQFHPSAVKSWVKFSFSAGTPTIDASYNVSSLTDLGVGLTQVNYTTAFSSANYASGASNHADSNGKGAVDTQATGSARVLTRDSAGALADHAASFWAMGDQ